MIVSINYVFFSCSCYYASCKIFFIWISITAIHPNIGFIRWHCYCTCNCCLCFCCDQSEFFFYIFIPYVWSYASCCWFGILSRDSLICFFPLSLSWPCLQSQLLFHSYCHFLSSLSQIMILLLCYCYFSLVVFVFVCVFVCVCCWNSCSSSKAAMTFNLELYSVWSVTNSFWRHWHLFCK